MELNDNTVDIFSPYYKIDLCACFDPIFYPPKELIEEWNRAYEPEPTLENTSYYGTELTVQLTSTAAIPASAFLNISPLTGNRLEDC